MFVIAYIVKTYRIAVLWFVMYLLEKVYLDKYLNAVFLEDKPPVGLLSYILVAMAVESVAFFLLLLVLFLMMRRFKGPTNSFVIDGPLLKALFVDYLLTTGLIVALGAVVASAVQDGNLFRYSHDGLRGIRACADILIKLAIVILLCPLYLVAAP
jgi:hypothetical protein